MHKRSIRTLLFALVVLCTSAASFAQIGISVRFGPPALPIYEQPLCPGEGFIWTPGFWAYDNEIADYYWVPGTWVLAPQVGYLWTPGYWGWGGDAFFFHAGYWGPRIGFYGGINYGFGYFGHGFEGGRWDHDRFYYNRSVTNVNITNIHNVYNTTVINNTTVNRVSYNGGNGGVEERARPEELAAEREHHLAPVEVQTRHMEAARNDRQQRASVNMGRPAVAATARPEEFKGHESVPAKEAGAPYSPPNRGGNQERTGGAQPGNNQFRPFVHPHELPAMERPTLPSTGKPKQDQKFQQQQEKMVAKQQQQRDKLQQRQERDHQQMARRNSNEQARQQVEQRHQQQTQQLQQRHQQQQQHFQQRVQQKSAPRR